VCRLERLTTLDMAKKLRRMKARRRRSWDEEEE
jgi:hypothetical protein